MEGGGELIDYPQQFDLSHKKAATAHLPQRLPVMKRRKVSVSNLAKSDVQPLQSFLFCRRR